MKHFNLGRYTGYIFIDKEGKIDQSLIHGISRINPYELKERLLSK